MITLLLDSSTKFLNVGIARDGKLIDYTSYEAWQAQSEYMVPELSNILKRNFIQNEDINEIMVAIGPGSYTGVRIALTIAKTIAISLSIPICPVNSLHVLKENNKPSICLIDARSNRSYMGIYQNEKVISDSKIVSNEEVIKFIKENPNYSICGDCEYLGIKSFKANVCEQMASLVGKVKKVNDSCLIKPIYLKEEYAIHKC